MPLFYYDVTQKIMTVIALTLSLLALLALWWSTRYCPPPRNGAIAQYCKSTDTFAINEDRLKADLKCRFCYFRNPKNITGRQKQKVFARHDPGGKLLEAYVKPGTPGALKRYRKFVIEHERAHQRLHRHRHTGGILDEDTIQMEAEANLEAYKRLNI